MSGDIFLRICNYYLTPVVFSYRYMSFPEEGKLWSEVHSLLEALQNDPGDAKNHFLTGNNTVIR